MKTKNFFKRVINAVSICLFTTTMMTGFTACTDDVCEESLPEETQLSGMLGASADTYNINDGEFTAENWREQEAIYIYDNQGTEEDGMGRKGYTLVNLPWYDGDKLTNLPTGFCDDLTRENGWELVLNRCGNRSIQNNNFMALYNKYTGTLRFFYFLPVNFQTGNDHVWQVCMTENMAQNTTLRYGVPQDLKLANKAMIGQNISGNIVSYTTPWVNSLSQDGLIVPNSGWWAFDVDLSLYSGKNYNAADQIALQMRSWQADHVSLSSLLAANIDGSIKANVDLLQSQHIGNSLFGMVGRLGSMGGSVNKAINAVQAEKWGDAFSAGIDFGKTVANMCGIKTESCQDIQGTINGSVALAMNGTISTEGIVQGSRPVENIASPTFMFKDFNREYAPALGEGIWNLETSPVVYYTNAQIQWRHDYETYEITRTHNPFYGEKEVYTKWGNQKSSFNAQKWYANKGLYNEDQAVSKDPWCGYVNYFDPSSIKVKLNPNVFTEEEIANAKVFATCGVRSANSTFGSLDDYRKALGLSGNQFDISKTNGGEYYNRPLTEAPFDALECSEDKMGMVAGKTFAISKMDGHNCGMFGRGDDDYILEPIPLSGDDHVLRTYMPSYEVTVTLVVEHDGKPIVYSRTYLPEYKYMEVTSMPAVTPLCITQKRPANYVEEIFEQQMTRIRHIQTWTRRTLQSNEHGSSNFYGDPKNAWVNLIDGDINTKWSSQIGERSANDFVQRYWVEAESFCWKDKHCLFAEFKTNYPISPLSYTLVTSADNASNHSGRPRTWALLGKKTAGGSWVVLDKEETATTGGTPNNNALPQESLKEKDFFFNGTHPDGFQYFRLEILNTWNDDINSFMNIGEFRFNYYLPW